MEQVSEETEISQQLSGWKSQVASTRAGIKALEDRLQQRAAGMTERHELVEVEHFQNQFICQREVADTLYHDLKQAVKRMPAAQPDGTPLYQTLEDRTTTFVRLYNALQADFERFWDNA